MTIGELKEFINNIPDTYNNSDNIIFESPKYKHSVPDHFGKLVYSDDLYTIDFCNFIEGFLPDQIQIRGTLKKL